MIKKILIFVSGFVIGGAAGVYYTKHRIESEVDKRVEEAQETSKKVNDHIIKKYEQRIKDLEAKNGVYKKDFANNDTKKYSKDYNNEKTQYDACNRLKGPDSIVHRYESSIDDFYEDDTPSEAAMSPDEDDSEGDIYICSSSLWEEANEFNKIELQYYSDGVLCDTDDQQVDILDTVGYENRKTLDDIITYNGENYVYIKNDLNGTVYEISTYPYPFSSFDEEVR